MKAHVFPLLVGTALFMSACSASPTPTSPSASPVAELGDASASAGLRPGRSTIVDLVTAPDGEFDVLQAAVVRAGLVGALSGTTQYTVFAPTDQAFVVTLGAADEPAAIAAVQGLPLDALRNILLFHVTEGRRNSTSVLAAPRYTMLNGGVLTRETLTAAGVAQTDISASNGIVHVINRVLLP